MKVIYHGQKVFILMKKELLILLIHEIIERTIGAKSDRIILVGKGAGSAANQLYFPSDLDFDSKGNLYVADNRINQIQNFFIYQNSC